LRDWDKAESDFVFVPRKALFFTLGLGGAVAGFVGFIIGYMSLSGTC